MQADGVAAHGVGTIPRRRWPNVLLVWVVPLTPGGVEMRFERTS